jgi:hypothetical protein
MILEKREPLLLGVTTVNHAPQISGHGPFRDGEAQLLQFGVNLGSAPGRILLGPTSDQFPHLWRDPRPPAMGT